MDAKISQFLKNSEKRARLISNHHSLKDKIFDEAHILSFILLGEDESNCGFYTPLNNEYGLKINTINNGLFEIGTFMKIFGRGIKCPPYSVIHRINYKDNFMTYVLPNYMGLRQIRRSDYFDSNSIFGLCRNPLLMDKVKIFSQQGLEVSKEKYHDFFSCFYVTPNSKSRGSNFVLTDVIAANFDHFRKLILADLELSPGNLNPYTLAKRFISERKFWIEPFPEPPYNEGQVNLDILKGGFIEEEIEKLKKLDEGLYDNDLVRLRKLKLGLTGGEQSENQKLLLGLIEEEENRIQSLIEDLESVYPYCLKN